MLDADPGIAERNLDLDLRDAHAMRNRLAHDYDEVSLDIVWNTLKTNLPGLKDAIDRLRPCHEAV